MSRDDQVEEWGIESPDGVRVPCPSAQSASINAAITGWRMIRRYLTDWEPFDPVVRADCSCARCHSRPFPIMHVCPDCGNKRCPRAADHNQRCESDPR